MYGQKEWDYLIVGTGMGGATVGYELARAWFSVLFCEKGNSYLNLNSGSVLGTDAELNFTKSLYLMLHHANIFRRSGRAYEYLEDRSKKKSKRFIPFISIGGSFVVCCMAQKRFSSNDFHPKKNFKIPSSVGINPALTIAANTIGVADYLIDHEEKKNNGSN